LSWARVGYLSGAGFLFLREAPIARNSRPVATRSRPAALLRPPLRPRFLPNRKEYTHVLGKRRRIA